MSKRILLFTLPAALMLTACGTGTPPTLVVSRHCPANLTAPCSTPPPAASGKLADLFQNHIEAMEQAKQCRDQLQKLAQCENKDAVVSVPEESDASQGDEDEENADE